MPRRRKAGIKVAGGRWVVAPRCLLDPKLVKSVMTTQIRVVDLRPGPANHVVLIFGHIERAVGTPVQHGDSILGTCPVLWCLN